MAELKLSLKIDDTAAIKDVKAFQKIIDDLKKQLEGLQFGGKSGSGGGSMPKTPKPDLSAFKDYRIEASRASVETVKLGRDLDQLNKRFGIGSKEAKDFSSAQLANNRVLGLQQGALVNLKRAYQDGAVGIRQYQLETAKLINQQANFKNKMSGASPIRNMQSMMSQMLGSMGGELNRFTTGQLMIPDAISPARLMAIREGLLGVQEAGGGVNATMASMATTGIALGASLAVVTVGMFALFNAGVKSQAAFQENQNTLTTLLAVTNNYLDAAGRPLGFAENFKIAQQEARKMGQIFDVEAARIAGVERQHLDYLAKISGSQIAKATGGDTVKQAKLTGGIAASLAPLGLLDEKQMRQESRSLFADKIMPGSMLAENVIANQFNNNSKAFLKARDAAIEAGKGYEFFLGKGAKFGEMQGVLSEFMEASKLMSGSFENSVSIMNTAIDMFSRNMGERMIGVKKSWIDTFSSVFNDSSGGLKTSINDIAQSIGANVGSFISSFTPLIKPLTEFGLIAIQTFAQLGGILSPFITLLSGLLVAIFAVINGGLELLNAVLAPVSDMMMILNAILLHLIEAFVNMSAQSNQTSSEMTAFGTVVKQVFDAIGGAFKEFHQFALLITQDFTKGMQYISNSVVAMGQTVATVFYKIVENVLNAIASLIQRISGMISGFLNKIVPNGVLGGVVDALSGGMVGQLKNYASQAAQAGSGSAIKALGAFKANQTLLAGVKAAPKSGVAPFDFGDDGDGKKKKGKKGPSQESLDNKADADLARENKKKAAAEALAQSQKEYEEKLKFLNLDEEIRKKEQEIFNARLQANTYSLGADQKQHELDMEAQSINNAYSLKQITENQKDALLLQNSLKKVELKYQNDLHDISVRGLKVKEKELEIEHELARAALERKNIANDIGSKQSQMSTLRGQLANGDFKTDKAKDTAEEKISTLTKEIQDLNQKLETVASESRKKIIGLSNDVISEKAGISLDKNKATQERRQAIESENQKALQTAQTSANTFRDSLVSGAKEIFNQIKSAFSDGKLSIEEAFGILDSIFNKLSDIFKSGGSGGAGGSLGSIGSLFGFGGGGATVGGGSGKFDASSLTRGTDGMFEALNTTTGKMESLGTSCGISAREIVGLGGASKGLGGVFGALGGIIGGLFNGIKSIFSGIGGLFGKGKSGGGGGSLLGSAGSLLKGGGDAVSGLGGATGAAGAAGGAATMNPAGAIFAAASTVLQIGMTAFSFFSSRAKKKKEAKIKKQIQEIQALGRQAFDQIDLMERAYQERLRDFKDKIDDINRIIKKIEVGTSIFQSQKVIEQTAQQLKLAIDELGKGEKLQIFTSYFNAYWQGMSVLMVSVGGMDKEATGAFAERNKQIQSLINAREQIKGGLVGAGGEVEKVILDQINDINKKILEINDNFNQQIRDLTNQSKDLQDALDKAIEQQKANFLTWTQRINREKLSLQFGDVGGSLFDSMQEIMTQIREVLISGIDPQQANFLVQRLKEQGVNKLKNQYRDFIEGVNDSYLKSIFDLQDRLQAVISEGRVTGTIKKTQVQKLQEIQREIDRLKGEQVQSSSLKLDEFGLSLDSATNALDAMTKLLDANIQQTLNEVKAGQYRAIDSVNINAIFDPALIAAEVQKYLNAKLTTPSLVTVPLV